jgi:hypothetical protein
MTTDDERIAHLAGDGAGERLDPHERLALDETRALLADPSVWAEPAHGLEDAVVAAVVDAAGLPRPADERRPDAAVRASRLRRRASLVGAAAVGAAAVVAAVVLTVAAVGRDGPSSELSATLRPTELAPGAGGRATFTRTDSGWRIDLDATGLPRLADGRFYQAWLRDDAGVLVAIGTFNEAHDVVLWSGVSPDDFSTITVTEERADGDPGSSGRRVLVGTVEPDGA